MREEYNVQIVESSKELSARERIKMKDFSNALQLDTVDYSEHSLVLSITDYAILKVHNELAKDNKDYTKIVITDSDGKKYITGSKAFIDRFIEIYDEMQGEAFEIEVYKRPSRNYKDKEFITCSIV